MRGRATQRAATPRRGSNRSSGGFTFAEDPDRAAPEARIIWHADLDPGTLRVIAVPSDPADPDSIRTDRLAPWLALATDSDGREHAVLSDGWHRIRVDVEEGSIAREEAVLLQYRLLGVTAAREPFQQSLQVGRLGTLARLGLAERLPEGRWRLAEGIEDTLRRMGERGDIIRTLQRAYTARGIAPAAADLAIFEPAARDARPIIGRVLERGLSDEHKDRHYLLVEATDGRAHYVDIGKGEALAPLPAGAIVRIAPERPAVREVDRTIAAVAAANGGRYTIDAHLRHDPTATEAFAETHVRRLEAMRRRSGAVERLSDGSWTIAPDHLDRAAAYEAARAGEAPVHVETLSAEPLERLAGADAATWLDRELVTSSPEPLREAGFGQAVREAQHQRRQWLIAQGLAEEQANGAAFAPGLIDALRRRELLRVAAQLSDELGLPFRETPEGARVEGIYRRPVELLSGRHALIEKSREFTLVPWRPVLDRHVGKTVSGRVRGDGVSWTIGRGRSGPVIS